MYLFFGLLRLGLRTNRHKDLYRRCEAKNVSLRSGRPALKLTAKGDTLEQRQHGTRSRADPGTKTAHSTAAPLPETLAQQLCNSIYAMQYMAVRQRFKPKDGAAADLLGSEFEAHKDIDVADYYAPF